MHNVILSLLALWSFMLAFMLTPLCRDLAVARGWVDQPDHRKLHLKAVPRVGGVAIFIAFSFCCTLLLTSASGSGRLLDKNLAVIFGLLPALAVIFVVGLIDDICGLGPWAKLAGEVCAALIVCSSGILIKGVGGYTVVHWWTWPLTVLWLVACANSVNLIDGVDGLASGVALFATFTTFVAATLAGYFSLQLATVPLLGALIGFLRYNFNPASIFLGDCGSLTLGFLLGCYGVVWSSKSATLLGMTAPLISLAIPLLDTMLTILRRLLRGQPIFSADRGHLHHRLLDRGLTPRRVALLMYGLCGLAACASLIQSFARNHVAGLVLVLFCIGVCFGIQRLGYVEFNVAGRLARARTFRRVLNAYLRLYTLEDALVRARSVDACWTAIRSASFDFGFTHVALRLDHTALEDWRDRAPSPDNWTLHVPLSDAAEYVTLGCGSEAPMEPMVVGPLADVLRRTLTTRVAGFQTRELESGVLANTAARLNPSLLAARVHPGTI